MKIYNCRRYRGRKAVRIRASNAADAARKFVLERGELGIAPIRVQVSTEAETKISHWSSFLVTEKDVVIVP